MWTFHCVTPFCTLNHASGVTESRLSTSRLILSSISKRVPCAQMPKKIFWAFQAKEQARFMTDAVLELHIKRMTKIRPSLLTPMPITLTETGRKALAGELNFKP